MKSTLNQSDTGRAENAPEPHQTVWALAGLSLSVLLASLGTSIANVGLPTLALAFHASFQQVQWVVLAYLLAMTTVIVSVGRLGDIMGRKRLLVAGILLFTSASVLCGAASTLWLLIAARALQGLGAAAMMVLAMAMVGESVPKAKTGSALGVLGTMSAAGTAMGPTLGGGLISGLGWTSMFFINVPLGILTLYFVLRGLPSDRQGSKPQPSSFDGTGTLLLSMTLAAYALAMTLGRGNFGRINMALLALAFIGVWLFIRVESRATSPLIRLNLFLNRTLSTGFAMSTLVTTVVMATLVVGPFYLSGALALDSPQVGLAMSSGPLVAALTGAPAGRLVDRFGAYRMTLIGLIGMLIGSCALPMMTREFGVAGYMMPLMGMTAGYAIFQAANNTAVMANVQTDQRGVISGLLNLSRNVGLIAGASLMGAVFAFGAETTHILTASPQALVAGLRMTFAVATGLIVVALTIAVANRSRARPKSPVNSEQADSQT